MSLSDFPRLAVLGAALACLALLPPAWRLVLAAEGDAPTAVTGPVEPRQWPKQKSLTTKKESKRKRIREKEAEGTQAPNRFETDTVIKSRYELNGRPLEVDPD